MGGVGDVSTAPLMLFLLGKGLPSPRGSLQGGSSTQPAGHQQGTGWFPPGKRKSIAVFLVSKPETPPCVLPRLPPPGSPFSRALISAKSLFHTFPLSCSLAMPAAVSLSLMILSVSRGAAPSAGLGVAAALYPPWDTLCCILGDRWGWKGGSCLLIHVPGQGVCDRGARALLESPLEFLHVHKTGEGAPQIFFSPAQGRSFAKRDFFPFPL